MLKKKNALKVAHVVTSLQVGGAERFVIDLCQTQKHAGEQPMIVSLGLPGEPLEAECIAESIPYYSRASRPIIKLSKIYFLLKKVDIIHIHSPHALKFFQYILPTLKADIIYTRHGAMAMQNKAWKKLHSKVQRYIKAVTFVSQEAADIFLQNHRWGNVASFVIDNGVLISPVTKQPAKTKNKEKLRIGSVGRMVALKNQQGLLKALALLPDAAKKDVEVHFFGDGDCLTQLQSFDKASLSAVNINFHGMVNDREQIYSTIDVLVVCSETEGLSMVIIEAMANNIPVIATDVGGNPKLVLPNKTGWLFDYDDNEKLSEIIQSILDNRDIIAELGNKAYNYISENFSIEASANKYAKIYRS